jgi:acyl carrier protein
METTVEEVLAEVSDRLGLLLGGHCQPDEHLFSARRLDSLALIELVEWAGSHYGVDIAPGDLSLANFDTARRCAQYLASRVSSG